ncbi:uncharacterized protein MAL13P1.304-like isoform X2 [Sipha flava]|nr:uncharacterized protein MAL13P1.304-like isoform X2 [Sipha flava]
MAEVNEINNQTNLDYIFDSYYSSVSQYNSNFGLPEDCKNMSFSELFDQELFSTNENKDCKITIKIEEEEPSSIQCYSVDDSQDIIGHQISTQIEENISPLTSLPKSFAPKRGINRTSIKTTDSCDVKQLMCNPFFETDDLDIDKISVKVENPSIKLEPEYTDDTIVGMEVKLCCSTDDSQNLINKPNLVNIEDGHTSLMTKTSTESTENCNIKHEINNSFYTHNNLNNDKNSVVVNSSTLKLTTKHFNDDVEQNIVKMKNQQHYVENTIDSNSILIMNDKVRSELSKNTISKPQDIVRTSVKSTAKSNVKNFMFNSCHSLQDNKMSIKNNQSITKCKLKNVNNNIKHNIKTEIHSNNFAGDLQHMNNSNINVINEDDIASPSSRILIQKCPGIYKTTLKPIKNCDVKHLMYNTLCQSKKLKLDQKTIEINTSFIKCESEDINYTIDQNVNEKEIQPHYSQKNTTHNHSILKIEEKVPSLLSKNVIPQRQVNSRKSLKSQCSNVKNLMFNPLCTSQNQGNNKMPIKINLSTAKCEPKYVNSNIEQKIEPELQSYYSTDDLQYINNSEINIKVENNIVSSVSKSSPKYRDINKSSLKTTENTEIKHLKFNNLCQTKNLGLDPKSAKFNSLFVKSESEDIYNTNGQKIDEINVKSYCSSNGLQSATDHHNFVKVESSVLKYQGINTTPVKMIKNCEVIRPKPKNINDIIQKKIVKMEVQTNDKNLNNENKIEYDVPNEICSLYSSDTIIESVNSQNCILKNELNLETEKKKISMEEYRAKRGKISLLKNTSENITESTTELVETDNGKLKAIKEEFDRNTNEHFIGQKRKIEDEDQSPVSKEIINEEDKELQTKRMKIEYIKKLLPSSFASEIAKTSSLMKGTLVEDNENENNSDNLIMSYDKTQRKYTEMYNDLEYSKKEEKSQRKGYLNKTHPFYRSSRSDYSNKSGRSSSSLSNSDDYYNRNRSDSPQQNGQYGQNVRNPAQRSKEQKRVVYVGQIPIKFGKRYLYSRFEEFGSIISLTLHKKPDFRVYYAFVTYSDKAEAERAINHGNDDRSQVQLDIRFGERKQTQTPYYDLDDEWLTDWYGYNSPVPVVRARNSPEKVSFQEELEEFYKLAQIKKLNQKSSQIS